MKTRAGGRWANDFEMKTGAIFTLWEGSWKLPGKDLHEAFQLEVLSNILSTRSGFQALGMVFQYSHEIGSLVWEHHGTKGSRAEVSNCFLRVSIPLRKKAAAHEEATSAVATEDQEHPVGHWMDLQLGLGSQAVVPLLWLCWWAAIGSNLSVHWQGSLSVGLFEHNRRC